MTPQLSVREAGRKDLENMVDYFLGEDSRYHIAMGVDKSKMPGRRKWLKIVDDELQKPLEQKSLYYLVWLLNNEPIAHCNINKIIWQQEAFMHLHVWTAQHRGKGHGVPFVKLCLPIFFEKFQLQKLYCDPYALNPGPNKVLKQVGFTFIEEYEGIPGWIAFYQPVNRWVYSRSQLPPSQ